HGEATAVGEQVFLLVDECGQPVGRGAPGRARVSEVSAEGGPATQGVVHAGTDREQGMVSGAAVLGTGPQDLSVVTPKCQSELEPTLDGGPHAFGEGLVPGGQQMVEDPHCRIGGVVGLPERSGGDTLSVFGGPSAVGAAHRVQPQVGTPCGLGVFGYGQPG